MNFNLLDLDNDILNIIGDYVKKDNIDRIENFKKVDILGTHANNNDHFPLLFIDSTAVTYFFYRLYNSYFMCIICMCVLYEDWVQWSLPPLNALSIIDFWVCVFRFKAILSFSFSDNLKCIFLWSFMQGTTWKKCTGQHYDTDQSNKMGCIVQVISSLYAPTLYVFTRPRVCQAASESSAAVSLYRVLQCSKVPARDSARKSGHCTAGFGFQELQLQWRVRISSCSRSLTAMYRIIREGMCWS